MIWLPAAAQRLKMFCEFCNILLRKAPAAIWLSLIHIYNKIGELSQKLYDELYGIQTGEIEDKRGWTVPVE